MTNAGYLMIGLGFLGGAFYAVIDVEDVAWGYYAVSLAAGALGVMLVRTGVRRHQVEGEEGGAGLHVLQATLGRIVDELRRLRAEGVDDPYAVHGEIDRRLAADLGAFTGARDRITRRAGLQAYADVMSHFAAAERYLNRAWTASTDGYVDEVEEYLRRSEEQFEQARTRLAALAA